MLIYILMPPYSSPSVQMPLVLRQFSESHSYKWSWLFCRTSYQLYNLQGTVQMKMYKNTTNFKMVTAEDQTKRGALVSRECWATNCHRSPDLTNYNQGPSISSPHWYSWHSTWPEGLLGCRQSACNDAWCFLLVPCTTSVGGERFGIKPRSLPYAAVSHAKLQETGVLQLPSPHRDRSRVPCPHPDFTASTVTHAHSLPSSTSQLRTWSAETFPPLTFHLQHIAAEMGVKWETRSS